MARYARERYPKLEDLCIFATDFGAYVALSAMQELMELRKNYLYKPGDTPIFAADGEEKYQLGAASPILSQGDLMGCVMLLLGEGDGPLVEADQGLAKTAAGFLGRQMES